MNTDWKNKQSILRDLAIAQGNVPVASVDTVSSDAKPPSLQILEETEEHFLQQYVADGNSNVTPDLGLLQKILEEVRDIRVAEIESPEIVDDLDTPKTTEDKSLKKGIKVKVDKCKRNRNVAIESIMDMDHNKEKAKETKRNCTMPMVVPPENMFRVKTSKSVEVSKNVVNSSTAPSKVSGPGVFKPSNDAQDYYNRAIEKKRQKEIAQEDIWKRAERQMKEIEAKRKQTNVAT